MAPRTAKHASVPRPALSLQKDSRLTIVVAAFILVAAGVAVYANSFAGVFLMDDASITDHAFLWKYGSLRECLFGSDFASRPLVGLSVLLNFSISGLNVWSYHAFNLIVHLLASVTLFGVLRRTFQTERLRQRFGAHATWLAFACALLWNVHPLQTGTVTYISQRAEGLMSLFYLLSLYCVIRGFGSRAPRWWHVGAIGACVLGMGCKQVMVTAPVVILLYDCAFLSGSFRGALGLGAERQGRSRRGLYLGLGAADALALRRSSGLGTLLAAHQQRIQNLPVPPGLLSRVLSLFRQRNAGL